MDAHEKTTKDRRRLQRFPAIELEAELKAGRGLFGHWQPVQAYDFTRTGLSLVTEHPLQVDQVVSLRLRLPLATGDLTAERLVARVRNLVIPPGAPPRYGLEFDFQANRHMKSLATAASLGRMEGILDRSEKLQQRILSQRQEEPA